MQLIDTFEFKKDLLNINITFRSKNIKVFNDKNGIFSFSDDFTTKVLKGVLDKYLDKIKENNKKGLLIEYSITKSSKKYINNITLNANFGHNKGTNKEINYKKVTNKKINNKKATIIKKPLNLNYIWDMNNTHINQYKDELKKLHIKHSTYCYYCGKGLIFNLESDNGKIKSSYHLDHFLCKSKYPLDILNPFNIFPSCYFCNSVIKNDLVWDYNEFVFSPFYGWIKFSSPNVKKIINYNYKSKFITDEHSINKLWISINGNGDCDYFFEKMNLDKIYLSSEDTYKDFGFMYDKYMRIKSELRGFFVNNKKINQLVDKFFANWVPKNAEEVLNYCNGKMRYDIISYMKKILEEGR